MAGWRDGGMAKGACALGQAEIEKVPAQGAQADRKDAKASSLTARPAPSMARDALLFCLGSPRPGFGAVC